MSSKRKPRRPGDDNRDRERRHMAWLSLPGNGDSLVAATQDAYQRRGRGFWFASDYGQARPDITRMYYVPIGEIAIFPEGRNRAAVARMVATYDPVRQMIVVIEEDSMIRAWKIPARGIAVN